jgi:hypothetical protein
MTRALRALLVMVVGLAVFLAPATVTYALWSAKATGTATVTVASPSPTAPPATPVVACGSRANNNEFSIAWAQVTGATQYTVHRSATNLDGSYSQIATVAATSPTSYTASIETDGTHFFRLRAANAAGTSAFGKTVSIVRVGNGNNQFTCAVLP